MPEDGLAIEYALLKWGQGLSFEDISRDFGGAYSAHAIEYAILARVVALGRGRMRH